jgi:hypothetical protein
MAIRKLNAQAKRMKACKGKTGSAFKTCAFGGLGGLKRKKSKKSLGEMEDMSVCHLVKKGPRKGETVCKKITKRGAVVRTGLKGGKYAASVFYSPNPGASARGKSLSHHPKARLWQSLMTRASTKCCPGGKGTCGSGYRSCMSSALKQYSRSVPSAIEYSKSAVRKGTVRGRRD